ncbi:hypothetical protein CHS0354_034680 [Potamilus streckersoni]|uniref:Uncharacterized protein n=1 Tax=Potamilus streckersoni TaxID=2493646 RepID=A0AAE0TC34_9BIVA|nr:hypothetical protein CHS0354_034680 [Potamilus streckersoni]
MLVGKIWRTLPIQAVDTEHARSVKREDGERSAFGKRKTKTKSYTVNLRPGISQVKLSATLIYDIEFPRKQHGEKENRTEN